VSPGHVLFVSDKLDATFAEVSSANRLLFRGITCPTASQKTRIFMAEFKVSSLLLQSETMCRAIAQSKQSKLFAENLCTILENQEQENKSAESFSFQAGSKTPEKSDAKNSNVATILNSLGVFYASALLQSARTNLALITEMYQ
jgi:hypothetical protein